MKRTTMKSWPNDKLKTTTTTKMKMMMMNRLKVRPHTVAESRSSSKTHMKLG